MLGHRPYLLVVVLIAATLPYRTLGQRAETYCFTDDPDPYIKFGTKTAYTLANGEFTHEDLVPAGCEARQAWHLVRHGTRYPSEDDIAVFLVLLPTLQDAILLAHQDGQGELCEGDLKLLADWSLGDLNVSWANVLTSQGHLELEGLATRYKEAIPLLLDQPFTNESFKFRHTATQRTEASARSYAQGLFGSDVYMPSPIDPDPLLKFYKVCNDYVTEVADNPEATIESQLYQEGEKMATVVDNVSLRLGIPLGFEEIEVLYDACRYYKAWDPTAAAAWCVAFTSDDLKVMEYWEDLYYYYTNGYAYPINYEMACPPVQDLIQHFSSINSRSSSSSSNNNNSTSEVVESGEGPSGVFYFTHVDALVPVMTRLGLYKDPEPLTHDHEDPDRLWRSSSHGIFATNLAFTLSSCGADEWWVSLAMSEQVVALGGCASPLGCTWEEFMATYGFLEQCDLDAICNNAST
ncbi:multiple inositol polyphosphate phosphatase 1-like isoform X2 [Cherax quadricarinatus]|uniref:multiple inositol polyphosphate phosphatase 1-like isoform X2 n=1 Tax=Cherax quadricarinatus TaxID=27406 RepID=UPI00387E9152